MPRVLQVQFLFLAALLCLPGIAWGQVSAAEPALIPYPLPRLLNGSLDFGDLDGDGDLDLLLTGLAGPESPLTRIYVLEDSVYTAAIGGYLVQLSFKVYRPVQSIVNHVWDGTARWGDFDGDGDDDVLLFGLTYVERVVGQRTIEVVGELYRNNRGSLVQQTSVRIPGLHAGDAAWADMDGDGDMDFAACGATSPEPPYLPATIVYENTGAGGLRPLDVAIPDVMLCSLAWGDMDGDGFLELAVSGQGTDRLVTGVFRNSGDAGFEELDLDLPSLVLADLEWADFDGDGLDDLLATGGVLDPQLLRGRLLLLRSTGVGFQEVETGIQGVVSGNIAWLDYDVDGDPDIVLSGAETVLGNRIGQILVNTGGDFRREYGLAGLTQGDMAIGDYNGDGDQDILFMGVNDVGDPFVNFLMNLTFPEFLPPGLITR
ncbi:MAG: hypothetical protein ACI80V_001125 [Rhodothermales bacterium]|jgi:hypothetical protein